MIQKPHHQLTASALPMVVGQVIYGPIVLAVPNPTFANIPCAQCSCTGVYVDYAGPGVLWRHRHGMREVRRQGVALVSLATVTWYRRHGQSAVHATIDDRPACTFRGPARFHGKHPAVTVPTGPHSRPYGKVCSICDKRVRALERPQAYATSAPAAAPQAPQKPARGVAKRRRKPPSERRVSGAERTAWHKRTMVTTNRFRKAMRVAQGIHARLGSPDLPDHVVDVGVYYCGARRTAFYVKVRVLPGKRGLVKLPVRVDGVRVQVEDQEMAA